MTDVRRVSIRIRAFAVKALVHRMSLWVVSRDTMSVLITLQVDQASRALVVTREQNYSQEHKSRELNSSIADACRPLSSQDSHTAHHPTPKIRTNHFLPTPAIHPPIHPFFKNKIYHLEKVRLELPRLPSNPKQPQPQNPYICPNPHSPTTIQSLDTIPSAILFSRNRPHCPKHTRISSHRNDRLLRFCYGDLAPPEGGFKG